MRLENRCYSSSAINNDNVKCNAEIDSRSNVNQHSTLRGTKKGKNSGGFFSFLQKLRVVNKPDLVGSTFSFPSPYSSQYSVATGRAGIRWESAESVISSATASSFAFIPSTSHQLRQFNYKSNAQRSYISSPSDANVHEVNENARVHETRQDHLLRRRYRPIYDEQNGFVDAKKLYRNSTGNIENIVVAGNDPCLNDLVSLSANSVSSVSRKESTQKEKRKRCHKPGKRKAPEPPYPPYCDNIDDSSLPNKISTRRRKKRKAPSPPKIMAEMDESRGQGNEDNVAAVYNDSLKLEKGVLKAIKCCDVSGNNPNENSVIAGNGKNATSVPVSPKPWYKRSTVNASMKKISKSHEKRDSRRNCCIDEWMLESGLPRIKRISDVSKRTSQISMLANISELDREACEIIENERKKKREAEKKFYSDLLYDDGDDDGGLSAKTCTPNAKKSGNKDLISILNNITNVTTKITVNSPIFSKSIDVTDHSSREQRPANSSLIRRTKPLKNNYSAENEPENKTKSETAAMLNTQRQENKKTTAQKPSKAMVSKSDSSHRCCEKVETKLISQRHSSSQDAVHYAAPIRPVKPFSSWTCPQCTLENPSWKFICELCHKWRPYSVTRTQNAVVSPKQDIALKSKHDESELVTRADEKIRSNANSLTDDDGGSTSTWRREPASDENAASKKNEATSTNTKMHVLHSLTSNDRILQDLEQIRKARLQFFSKSITNKWADRNDDNSKDKLCEILKELKDSLPFEKNAAKMYNISHAFKSDFGATNHNRLGDDRNYNSTCTSKSVSGAVFNRASSTKSEVDSVAQTQANVFEQLIIQEPAALDKEDPLCSWQQRHSHPSSKIDKELLQDEARENRKVTALAVNRLLKKLQTAIGNGQHHEAANIARELARLKVNCHVTRPTGTVPNGLHSPNPKPEKLSTFVISLYINENNDCRGPIPLQIDNTMTLRKLKMKILDEFKIPLDSQRWIFEKTILDSDHDVLEDIGIDKPGAPLYLNLISNNNLEKESSDKKLAQNGNDFSKNVTIDEHFKSTNDSTRIENSLQKLTRQPDHLEIDDKELPVELALQAGKKTFQTTDSVVVNATENKIQMLVPSSSNVVNTADVEEEANTTGWKCGLCTLINETDRKFCSVCGHQQNTIAHATKIDEKTLSMYSGATEAAQNDLAEKLQQKSTNYQELIDLEKSDLIANKEDFECRVCLIEYRNGEGIVLRDCLHTFCKECLKQTIQHTTEAEVKCPFRDGNYSCESVLQQREIKALVAADVYEKHLARSVSEAENKIKNAFHCKTANCPGWCIYEDNLNEFHCPVCERTNCLTCQVIHTGLNCKQYQEMIRNDSETETSAADAFKTKSLLQEMVEKGEAMICPTCEIILMKKWGCDWLRCSMCKTEICWVTRGSRWGPAGKGDTTGGCRCGVNGIKCHPKCNYCH